MFIRQSEYNVEQLIVEGLNRGLTEQDIIEYYENMGYLVFKANKYLNFIYGLEVHPILKDLRFNDKIIEIFDKYKNGYPDILVIKDTYIKFIEIKLDGDSLKPNQVLFLDDLAAYVPTSVLHVNNLGRSIDNKEFHKITTFDRVDKNILNQIEFYNTLAIKKGLKPLWVAIELYKKFGKRILNKNVISVLSNTIHVPKDKIVWFLKATKEPTQQPTNRSKKYKYKK